MWTLCGTYMFLDFWVEEWIDQGYGRVEQGWCIDHMEVDLRETQILEKNISEIKTLTTFATVHFRW
jgi:hypothetical protein